MRRNQIKQYSKLLFTKNCAGLKPCTLVRNFLNKNSLLNEKRKAPLFRAGNSFAQRIFVTAMLFVLFSSLVEASDLHRGWHYSGETFTVSGDVILVTHYDFYDTTVILTVNKNGYILRKGECAKTATREYCIDDIFQDLADATEDDPIKFINGVPYAGIEILVRTRGPDIEVKRVFSTTTLELNKEVTVTVTIENVATEATDSFLYQEEVPAGVIITSSSLDTGVTSRSVKYSLNMPAKSLKSFVYSFKVTDYLEFPSYGVINYTYSGEKSSIKTTTTTIKVNKPYAITTLVNPSTVEAGIDKSLFSIKIESKTSQKINVLELKITIPPNLLVTSAPSELSKDYNRYTWQGSVEADEPKTIEIQVKPLVSGKYIIPVSIKLKDFAGKEFSETKNTSLTAEIKAIEPILSVLESSVAEGSTFRVAFSLKNPNKNIGFKNIKAIVKSPIFPEIATSLEELMAGQVKTLVIRDDLLAPNVEVKKTYDIEATGNYQATTGENYNFSKKSTLTVTPVADIISIVQAPEKSEVIKGQNVTVTISIKNNNQEAIQVNVYDEHSEGVSLIGGKKIETVVFDKSETKQAYTYKLHVPLAYDQSEIIINTFASIQEKGYSTNKTVKIKVKEPENKTVEPQQPPQQQQQNQSQLPTQEPVPEKKPGFFQQVINGITDFFRRLLGKG